MNIFISSEYWAVVISTASYLLTDNVQKRTKKILFNPLLISTIVTVLFLLLTSVDYDCYYSKANYLHYLLTPATVCLAIPLYEQLSLLKKNIKAIIIGICSGVLTSLTSILLFSVLFNLSHQMYVTLLPKSVTAAMGMGISEELGGISSLTVPIIIMTGITGNIIAEIVCKLFRIRDSIAKGIAMGTASHAMGTAKALEMGETEGAMSSLSIAVSGIVTVLLAGVYSKLY